VEWRRLGSDELIASLLSLAVVIFGGIGGLGGAIWTDILQGTLRIGLSFVLLPVVFRRIGGFGSLHTFEKLKPGILNFVADPGSHVPGEQEPFTPFSLSMLALAAVLGVVVQPQVAMICGSAKDERAARWGFTLGSLLKRAMALVWAVIGLGCLVWYLGPESPLPNHTDLPPNMVESLRAVATEDLSHLPEHVRRSELRRERIFADRAFGLALSDLLGGVMPGLTGLALAMILAAAVSHGSTQMIAASGMLADHLYRHHVNPGQSQRHYVRIALLFCPVVVGAALLLQTTFTGITDVLRLMIKTPAIIGISFWLGMFWPRWNTAAVWVSTLVGVCVAALCSWNPVEVARFFPAAEKAMLWQTSTGPVLRDSWQILFIISSALAAGLFTLWITEPQPEMQLEHFYRVLRTRVHPEEQQRLEDYQPPVDAVLSPAVFFLGLQLPAPTRPTFLEFLVACILAGSLVVLAKWLVMVL
jgi:Na+/proline symporter